MVNLTWVKNTTGNWPTFEGVNLDSVTTKGVYVIWHAGNPGRVVYVGQGDVAERLKAHRQRKDILAHKTKGTLYVTWAAVAVAQRDGVERYLADQWTPLVGDAHPNVTAIAVNSPW